jgi:hypothetical protein
LDKTSGYDEVYPDGKEGDQDMDDGFDECEEESCLGSDGPKSE